MSTSVVAHRDRWTDLGMALVGLSAAATSWAGWVGLAERCGFDGGVTLPVIGLPIQLSWLLPVAVDVYALTASRAWLRVPGLSSRTRSYARANALGAVTISILGNALYHWLAAQGPDAKPGMWLIVGVASIAPLMLGLVGHMSALVAEDRSHTSPVPAPADPGIPTPVVELVPVPESHSLPETAQHDVEPPVLESKRPTSGREATVRMRTFWDTQRVAGHLPSAAELEAAAEVPLSDGYARRKRREWLAAEN